jgi:hypothetical protein
MHELLFGNIPEISRTFTGTEGLVQESEEESDLDEASEALIIRRRTSSREASDSDEDSYAQRSNENPVERTANPQTGGTAAEIFSQENASEGCRTRRTTEPQPLDTPTPQTYYEAINGPDGRKWEESIQQELQAMLSMNVFEPCELPKGRKAIDTKWIFKLKFHPQEGTYRYKSRLVARGCFQKAGEDYKPESIYAPVARAESMKLILSMAAEEGLHTAHSDIANAFLNAPLSETIFIKAPKGYKDSNCTHLRLIRSIYGLRQSPYEFNQVLREKLLEFGLKQSKTETCVFFKNGNQRIIVLCYVDDLLIACKTSQQIDALVKALSKTFKINTKPLTYYLGVQIEINKNNDIHLHQTAYVEEILERFGMTNARSVTSPSDKELYNPDEEEITKEYPFRELIGSLLYLATMTRIDIAFTVNRLSKYLDKCTKKRWREAQRVLQYLVRYKSLGITFKGGQKIPTEVYSDSDFAADIATRKSVSGTLIMRQGGGVHWTSTTQTVVAQSSTEAELYSASHALRGSLWMTKLLGELGIQEKHTIYIDNMSCIRIIKNPVFHRRSKHISLKELMIRDHYEKQEIDIEHLSTVYQKADLLTKVLTGPRLAELRKLIGLETWKDGKKAATDPNDHCA